MTARLCRKLKKTLALAEELEEKALNTDSLEGVEIYSSMQVVVVVLNKCVEINKL